MLVDSLRVVLHLLEDHPHGRIVQDLLNFGIAHGASSGLLRIGVTLNRAIFVTLDGLRAIRVHLQSLFVDAHGLGSLADAGVNLRLPEIRFNEVGLELDALVAILESEVKGQQLGVAGRTIAVEFGVSWVSLDGFGVVADGGGEVSVLEQVVALLFLLLGDLGVDVVFGLLLLDHRLEVGESGSVFRRSVFGQGLLVGRLGVVEVVQFGVGLAHASHGLGDQLEVGSVLAAHLDGLDAGVHAFLVRLKVRTNKFNLLVK